MDSSSTFLTVFAKSAFTIGLQTEPDNSDLAWRQTEFANAVVVSIETIRSAFFYPHLRVLPSPTPEEVC